MSNTTKRLLSLAICIPALSLSALTSAENVTVGTFVRAESDFNIRANMQGFGYGVGELRHVRDPIAPDNQPTIRMNQDTLYSGIVVDLSTPVTITLPEISGRYQSMHVISQDHYAFVESRPGTYRLTEESVGTRFASVTFRTFLNVLDSDDIAGAHAAQDAITTNGGGAGPFDTPDWDLDDLGLARKALSDIAVLGFSSEYAFGRKDEVRPIDHLVGAAAGWGGLPRTAASYVLASVDANDGKTPYSVTVKDVPVNAFWSVTVYNADGYLEANDAGVNSYNNVSAQANADGSYTINFGGCDDGRINCIPISSGWNHAVRFYEPGEAILDGSWEFPEIKPAA